MSGKRRFRKSIYEKLTDNFGSRLIDFDNFENNAFYVVTELTFKKDDEEFRRDDSSLTDVDEWAGDGKIEKRGFSY